MIKWFKGTPLSNFWVDPFWVSSEDLDRVFGLEPEGHVVWEYPSGEHLFQRLKDTSGEVYFGPGMTPGQVKRAGRRLRLRSDWMEVRIDMMRFTIRSKFYSARHGAGRFLVETGSQELVEGNNWGDNFWGVANPEPSLRPGQLFTPKGENWLGRLLMERRDELNARPSTRLEVITTCPIWPLTGGERVNAIKAMVETFSPKENLPPVHAHVYATYEQAKKASALIMEVIPETVLTISFDR